MDLKAQIVLISIRQKVILSSYNGDVVNSLKCNVSKRGRESSKMYVSEKIVKKYQKTLIENKNKTTTIRVLFHAVHGLFYL